MKQLVDVILLIAKKYRKKMDLILSENILTLEYLTYKYGEKDVYKTLQVEEFEGKLKIKLIPGEIIKITDIDGLEDIISILDKQSNAKKLTKEEVEYIKKKYVTGTKIKLIKMYDFYSDIAKGEEGVITSVDDIGTIHVTWNSGATLGLIAGVDEFEII